MVCKNDTTVLTMVNDFQGDAKDFAVVIPVPTFLEKDQSHVGNQATVDHLDTYSAPRRGQSLLPGGVAKDEAARWADTLGVKVEAQCTVG